MFPIILLHVPELVEDIMTCSIEAAVDTTRRPLICCVGFVAKAAQNIEKTWWDLMLCKYLAHRLFCDIKGRERMLLRY